MDYVTELLVMDYVMLHYGRAFHDWGNVLYAGVGVSLRGLSHSKNFFERPQIYLPLANEVAGR